MAIVEFAGALAGVVTAQAGPPGQFSFPTDSTVRDELTATPGNWPGVVKHHLDDFVLPRFNAIPATVVPGVAGSPKVAWNTQPQLTKIIRKALTIPFHLLPYDATLPKSTPDSFDFKLHQLQPAPGDDIANGFQLVLDYTAANPNQVPAYAFATQNAAVQSINNVAAFEGFCIRLASAITAADRASVSLAETLALWRTEGDLMSPWSEQRRAANAPTYDKIEGIHLGDVRTDEVLFSMVRGLWSSRFNTVFGTAPLPQRLPAQSHFRNAIKLAALIEWSLVTAGLDFFWNGVNIAVDPMNRVGAVNAIATFLNAQHVAKFGAGAADIAARRADCNRVLDALTVTFTWSSAAERIVVAPTDPVALVSVMLAEALIFANLDIVAGKGPVVAPTPKLKYLAYHCQDHRDAADPAKDKFTLMLVSAAVSAARGAPGTLLRDSLQIAGLPVPADLGDLNFKNPPIVGDTGKHVVAFNKLNAAGWLAAPANLELLADFMIATPKSQWLGWEKLRSNMARYRNLLTYYQALLT